MLYDNAVFKYTVAIAWLRVNHFVKHLPLFAKKTHFKSICLEADIV